MQTKEQAMQKGDSIYVMGMSARKNERYGRLRINVHHKTKHITDVLMLTWYCDLHTPDKRGWEKADLAWDYKDFHMLPMLNQLNSLPFTEETTFEQVIDLLHQNEIEPGLFAELKDQDGQPMYSCYLSTSEIMAGNFTRQNPYREFVIQEKQKKQLIEELTFNKLTSPHLLLDLAQ